MKGRRRASLLFHRKHVYPDGAILEMKIWEIPKSALTPEGRKYSLVYVDPSGSRVLGYDNAHGKGHHRHFRNQEGPLSFESAGKLVTDFLLEVQVLRGE